MECRERGAELPPPTPRPRLTRDSLLDALENSDWNRSEAARRLGIDRTTVWRKIKQWKITAPPP
jgi:transcriptional regulator of acetoin/glycerol metabolism